MKIVEGTVEGSVKMIRDVVITFFVE